MISILIADEQVILIESLCMIFSREKDIKVAATAKDGFDAVCMCKQLAPDVVLISDEMPGISGIEATAMIKRCCPQIKVAILASLDSEGHIIEALKNGADAYLLKDIKPSDLIQFVKDIYRGYCVFSGKAGGLLSQELKNYGRTFKNGLV